MVRWATSAEQNGQRFDVVACQNLPSLSRSQIAKLILAQQLLINGEPQRASYKLQPEDIMSSQKDLTARPKLPKIDLPIVYQDDDCIVINKPAGILSHSKGAFNPEATVASFVEPHFTGTAEDRASDRAGIVHRLDRATSGVMIAAKNATTMQWLQKQFSQRNVKKVYYAVVEGRLEPAEAIIDMPIERNQRKPKTFKVSASGKPAITAYKEVSFNNKYSLLRLEPKTGRTHQLRVHLKQQGHPIVGDTFYDGPEFNGNEPARLFLHAASLEITLPGGVRKTFEVPLPESFETIMKS